MLSLFLYAIDTKSLGLCNYDVTFSELFCLSPLLFSKSNPFYAS